MASNLNITFFLVQMGASTNQPFRSVASALGYLENQKEHVGFMIGQGEFNVSLGEPCEKGIDPWTCIHRR